MHCRITSGDAPAILLLHQTASSSASYEPLMQALQLPNRLIAIDTPGFGGSFDPDGMPPLGWYAEQIIATADALGAETFHLFGHHTGASLAIEIAATHPERVHSIMLIGPAFMTDQERQDFVAGFSAPLSPTSDGAHLMQNWQYAAMYNADCDAELLHGEVLAMLRAWRGRPQAYMAVAHHDSSAAAQRVRAPVLLLSSPDDYFHPELERAIAAFPGAQVAITAGGNFQPTADAPGVARAIEQFLRSQATA